MFGRFSPISAGLGDFKDTRTAHSDYGFSSKNKQTALITSPARPRWAALRRFRPFGASPFIVRDSHRRSPLPSFPPHLAVAFGELTPCALLYPPPRFRPNFRTLPACRPLPSGELRRRSPKSVGVHSSWPFLGWECRKFKGVFPARARPARRRKKTNRTAAHNSHFAPSSRGAGSPPPASAWSGCLTGRPARPQSGAAGEGGAGDIMALCRL